MSQYPYGPHSAHGPGTPGSSWAPGPTPPTTPDLRLLLRLTVASFALSVLGGLIGYAASSEQLAAAPGVPFLGTGFVLVSVLLGIGFNAGLYALVYFPLREQRQWAWILGIVFASLTVLGTLVNVVLFLAVPAVPAMSGVQGAMQPLHLLPAALKLVVDVVWLVVAVRPGVRAALR